MSIRPKWCELIASGKKTIEIRKTKPKLETPFKVYIYQTKRSWIYSIYSRIAEWQGKVIGEFVCNGITTDKTLGHDDMFNIASCLNVGGIAAYFTKNEMYGWHISDLKIYDKPKDLSKFDLERPPQSWCYVEEQEMEEFANETTDNRHPE